MSFKKIKIADDEYTWRVAYRAADKIQSQLWGKNNFLL